MKKRQNKRFDPEWRHRDKRLPAAGLRYLWQNTASHFDAYHAELWPLKKSTAKTKSKNK